MATAARATTEPALREGVDVEQEAEASSCSSSDSIMVAAEAESQRSFKDLITDLGALQVKLSEAHDRELLQRSSPTSPLSCPPKMEVQNSAGSTVGAPEKRLKGRLAPVVHKFLLARRLGAPDRRLSEERESETVRQALHDRRQSITATDRVALAMRDAAAFEEQVRKEASIEVDRYQLRSNFAIDDDALVEMKRRCITKQSSELAAGHRVSSALSGSEQAPTPAEVQEDRMLNSWSQLFPIHPSSRRRLLWEMLAMFLLIFDMVVTPMVVFDLPDSAFTSFIGVTSTIYWTADIPMSMVTATYRNGKLVTSYRSIFRLYLRSWMVVDVLLVTVDWAATIADLGTADTVTLARTVRTGRILRMLRLARLLRVVKLKRLFDDLKRRLAGEIVVFVINVGQLFVSTMLLTHVLACVWYWLGSEEDGWVYTEGLNGLDLGATYIQSMQWSLSRLHPISLRDNMKLRLPQERMFSLVASFGSLLFSSIFISYVTNTMAKLARMWKDRSRKLGAIGEYAATHRINSALTVRLKKYIEREEERVKWKAHLQVLESALPAELLRVLYHASRTPTLVNHDLFSKIKNSASHTMIDLCYDAVHEQHILAGDTIFETGGVTNCMYMCESGKLRYSMDAIAAGRDSITNVHLTDRICCCQFGSKQVTPHEGVNKNRDSSLELTFGSWISEHALWTSVWQHAGNLSGTTDAQLLVIKSEDFGRVVQQDLPTFCDVVIYARYFVSEMNQTSVNTDLPPDQVVKRAKSSQPAALQDSDAFHDLLTTPGAGS